MHILKTFVDGAGRRHRVGDPIPKEWDKPALDHYVRHGMVGEAEKADRPAGARPRKGPSPSKTQAAAPTEAQSASPAEAQSGAPAEPADDPAAGHGNPSD